MKLVPLIICLAVVNADFMFSKALAESGAYDSKKTKRLLENVQNMIEQVKLDQAHVLLNQTISGMADTLFLPLLHQLATAYRIRRDYVAEAATYQEILQISPNDTVALRGRSFAALRMGAPDLATDYALKTPEVFSREELLDIRAAKAGRHIKWGELETRYGIGPDRFHAADRALLENAQVLEEILHSEELDQVLLNIQFDRVVALRNRMRMKQAEQLFLEISQRNVSIPSYVLAAAADAYLYLKRPKQAIQLYLQAVEISLKHKLHPEREWQFGLLQAYIDDFQFEPAQDLIEQLVAEVPAALHQGIRRAEVDNEYYERVQAESARVKLYGEQLDESEHMLSKILAAAPFSIDSRLALAELNLARNLPRKARDQYTSVLVDDPANLYASVGIADASMELRDYSTARDHLGILTENYPENFAVRRAKKEFDALLRPRLTILSGIGESTGSGGNRGNSDWQVASILDSGPILDSFSAFLTTFSSESDFDGDIASRHRLGIGIQYRIPSWTVAVQMDHSLISSDQIGVAIRSTWLPNDHWRLDTELASNSNRVPIQAHGLGVKANALAAGISYSRNESRNIGLDFSYLWFSDGNRRTGIGFNWFERWMSGPVYKLDTQILLSTSENSRNDVGYFNPRHDASIDLNMINEWTIWRRDQISFEHRAILGIGAYWQEQFGIEETAILRYEQQWNLDIHRSVNYGLEYSRHPYDGELNERIAFFLNLDWHF